MNNAICFASDAWIVEKNKAWFVDVNTCKLYEIDKTNYLCSQIGLIPGDVEGVFRQHLCATKIGDDIYLEPDMGKDIVVYNTKDKQFTRIELFEERCRLSLSYVCELAGKIVFFSLGLNELICVNNTTKIISDKKHLLSDINKVFYYDHKFYCISEQRKIIVMNEFLETEQEYIFSGLKSNISNLCFDGDLFWIIGRGNDIYTWDGKNEQLGEIYIPTSSVNHMDSEMVCYQFAKYVCNSIWLFPFCGSEIIVINCKTKETKIIDYIEVFKDMKAVEMLGVPHDYYFEYIYDNRYIGVYAVKYRTMLEIDAELFSSRILPVEFDDSCKNDIYVYKEEDPVDRKVFWSSLGIKL